MKRENHHPTNPHAHEIAAPGLYVHVPFCRAKCDYCGFSSAPISAGDLENWLQGLECELSRRKPAGFAPATVFFGGGTPTLIGANALDRVWTTLARHFDLSGVCETTIETNPDTLTAEVGEVIRHWLGLRISIGAQRFLDAELDALGRRHRADALPRAIDLALALTPRVGIDLILGVPSCPSIAPALDGILDRWPLEHVSSYFLTVEADTPLARRVARGECGDPDDVGPEELFAVADILGTHGFEHYEISNFARPGGRCRHNLATWHGADYLGIGPAAVSTLGGIRSSNAERLDDWLNAAGEVADREAILPVIARNERVMLGLRLIADGLDLIALRDTTTDLVRVRPDCGIDWLLAAAGRYLAAGDLELVGAVSTAETLLPTAGPGLVRPPGGHRLRLTRQGIARANTIIGHLLVDEEMSD